jgi:hypothetical protein
MLSDDITSSRIQTARGVRTLSHTLLLPCFMEVYQSGGFYLVQSGLGRHQRQALFPIGGLCRCQPSLGRTEMTYLRSYSLGSHPIEGSSPAHDDHISKARAAQFRPGCQPNPTPRLTLIPPSGAMTRSIVPPTKLFSHRQPLISNPAAKYRILPHMRCATTDARKNK